ncbi:MAG: hypothetical protein ABI338_01070 [Gemmatimonadaceae bacterium]
MRSIFFGVLNDDTSTQFRAALRNHCSDAKGSKAMLKATVDIAAAEAREKGIAAEQFVIWVKQAWDEIVDEGHLADSTDPAQMRDAVISSAIKAYYVQ